MLLTAEQLQEIRQIILDHHNAFVVNQYGPEAVAPDILAALKAKGLTDIELNTLRDAYVYGKVIAALGQSEADKLSYPQFKAYIKTNPIPLSSAEQHAVAVATQQAGALCQGLGNRYDKATGQILIEADAELRRNLVSQIRDKTAENRARRETIGQLKSDIGHATGDWTRDLNRIAVTETQSAMQEGLAASIAEEQGPEALVAKRVAPGCCFASGTLITTRKGPVPIEHVQLGDEVLTHAMRWQPVTQLHQRAFKGMLYGPENRAQATGDHPYLLDGAWQRLDTAKPAQNVIRIERRANAHHQPSTLAQVPIPFQIPVTLLTGTMPIAAVDFQRYFLANEPEINVVAADGHFWDRIILRQFRQNLFSFIGHVAQGALLLLGNLRIGLFGTSEVTDKVCLFSARLPLLGAESFGLSYVNLPHAFAGHPGFTEPAQHIAVRHAELPGDASGISANGVVSLSKHDIGDAAAFNVTHETCITVLGPIAQRFYEGPVFNFEVAQDSSYVADGYVVHNCDLCVKLYTGSDGAPRIFKLAELQAMGTNQGRKAAEARPVVGPVHPNCHPAGTMVTTSLGRRAIEHIYPGEHVWTHKQRLRRVSHVWVQHYQGKLVELELGWGRICATPNHPLFDGKTFKPAIAFKEGDTLWQDQSTPVAELDASCGIGFEGYATILHGEGPGAPFLALVFSDAVFVHEGFVYGRDRIADGPCVPALRGRLRFTRAGAASIAGGDFLALQNDEWVDDSCHSLVFRRATPHMAEELRLRCVTGPFARTLENWAEPIAADAKMRGTGSQAQAALKMQLHKQPQIQGRQTRAPLVRAAGGGQRPGDGVAVFAEHVGDGDQAQPAVMEQASHSFGVQVEPTLAARDVAPGTQAGGQRPGRDAQAVGYKVEGLVVVEMTARADVYVDLGAPGAQRDIALNHVSGVAQAKTISKVSHTHFTGAVYNLTVDEDESYIADSYVSHNCRCQLVSLPEGAGFNEQGQMSMKGTLGILTDPATLAEAQTHKSMLRKAMAQGTRELALFGVPVDMRTWAPPAEQGRWFGLGVIPHFKAPIATLVGPEGGAGDVYVVHSKALCDSVALGFTEPVQAALAYQKAFPRQTIASMEVLSLADFQSWLHAEERKTLPAQLAPPEVLVLSRAPADQGYAVDINQVRSGMNLSPNTGLGTTGANFTTGVPAEVGKLKVKRDQDIAGYRAWLHAPSDQERAKVDIFDRKATDIYANTPVIKRRDLKPELPSIARKDLKLIIARNRDAVRAKEQAREADDKMARVGAEHAGAFFGLGQKEKEKLAPKKAKKRKPKREPVQ